jgi:hypothetical protein
MQEIIYRALERDPSKRYAGASDFAKDLMHPENVVPADREEHRNWQHYRSPGRRMIWYYAMLAMIPVAIFVLLLYVVYKK